MKKVSIYLHGSQFPLENNRGTYEATLVYKNNRKALRGKDDNKTTSSRMMLTGLIEATKMLKEPCIINVYAPTNLGFSRPNKSVNKDLLNEFFNICEERKHVVAICT